MYAGRCYSCYEFMNIYMYVHTRIHLGACVFKISFLTLSIIFVFKYYNFKALKVTKLKIIILLYKNYQLSCNIIS